MIIKSNRHFFVILYLLVLSIIPIGFYLINSSNIIISIILEAVVIIFSIIMFFVLKKNEILFESTEVGINIKGSKEGKYDPDFIKYDEIVKCDIDGNRIRVKLKNDKIVILQNLGKDLENCHSEIIKQKNISIT
ncbi:MAG: hypothetical protein PQJ61_00515 [Spirochaetales bacterium]|uniref:Uncharacterized protein n=1 Tax=Candidatus Thalassospirochaeta sargassi TaxID=3119039 RepID=A0AAJ1MIW2_9SPIO|nr:hypothetical protein [Spirochaetales bacterium]